MKLYLFGLLAAASFLPACKPSVEKRAQSAVSEFISNGMSNTRYYQAGRFTCRPYTRKDSLTYVASLAQLNALADRPADYIPVANAPAQAVAAPAAVPAPTPADSVRIGTFVSHTYKEQNGTGFTMRDSGEFVVSPKGVVRPLLANHVLQARLKQAKSTQR
ncbi:hypothetical protein [Hymenobacter sp. BT491]|uniref:hypothetical protein n=1 Tax=Hymenobacter sp. BT491 TaxID=2766779 RepID=UPI001653A79A|nr:hypothetical protein [Hymenobacter sp. BT491]MBC6988499.1 hypothetical protein [Hymenobacter sp. BT491]